MIRQRNFWQRWNPFLERENNAERAQRNARRNEMFWSMVFTGNGISYTELREMDLAEFAEAVEARLLFQEKMKKQKEGADIG